MAALVRFIVERRTKAAAAQAHQMQQASLCLEWMFMLVNLPNLTTNLGPYTP